ncbi:putative ribonuclease H-like domain-containing protein [Tanacetum coccineum]
MIRFAPVARIEAIRLFLAYASFKDFVVYPMDVKSAFMYGRIEEEVYVCQPPGFEDPKFLEKVYKVEKALYGLNQAPKAWYESLSTYLLDNGFKRGKIDKTLFIKRIKGDILLIQVYVDDIIFGSTEFEKLMHKKFQMSSMGELTFFLGLQVTQKDDGNFISQDKYTEEILKKFRFSTVKTTSTLEETSKPLLKDAEAEDVDVHLYRSMIRSLMYLTASRPDIMFAVCACARFQVTPKGSHLHAVKRIFRYLKGQPKLGLWYPKDSPFDLEAYTDSDYARQTIVATSTTEAEYVAAASCYGQVLWIQNQMLDYGYNFIHTKIFIDNESTICIIKNPVFHSKTKHIEIRHHFIRDSNEKKLIQMIKIHTDHNVAVLLTKAFDTQKPRKAKKATEISQSSGPIHLVANETVIKEWEDRMEMAATTASSLEIEQDSGSGPRCQDTILGGAKAQIRFEAASKQSNDPPLLRVNILGSGEDNMILKELMELCTKLSERILDNKNKKSELLDDAEGTYCLPTATIFVELERIGYENLTQKLTFYKAYFSSQWKFLIHTILQCLSAKTIAWNEFSSTMASAIICLATNQKFNLSKYIFDNMVKNLEGGVKFLMYPRFMQVFLDKQVEGMTRHKEVYVTPSHTKKVFANMKRPGKGFSRSVTPLFQTMMVQASEDMCEDSAVPTDSHSTPNITQPSTSKPQKKKSRRKQRKDSGPTEPVTDEATNEAHVPTPFYDLPQSSKDRMQLSELMSICTSLQEKVLDLEETKTAQAKEIASLKKREDASKQERKIANIDANAEVTLEVVETEEPVISAAITTKAIPLSAANLVTTANVEVTISSAPTTIDELTLAQTLIEIKASKPKVAKDKGKAIIVEPERPLKKKDQVALNEEMARNLEAQMQAELIEEERLARQKEEEANIALIESWDNTQAMMEAHFELAQRLQAEEHGEITIEETSRLFVELINKRKKHFAKLKAEEIRRKPPTKAQKRNQMSTYLKNMAGYKYSQLKSKSYDEIQKLFDKEMKRVNTFIDIKSEVVKGSETRTEESSKRAGDELESDKSKKQKIDEHVEAEKDDDLEEEEMKKHMEIVQDEEEVATDAIPLATKPSMIVEYKIVKEGKIGHF